MSKIFTQSGAPVSRHAFGTMQFGGKADEEQSAAMFHAARIVGINHFDTAHLYTGGSSEEMLGQLAARDRDALIIATKVGYADGTPPEKLRADFDISRRRLGMEMVDILYLHRHDRQTPLEDQLAVLVALKEAGALRYIGLSNFAAWQVMKAERILREMGHGVDIIQPMYNLVKRQAEVELLPMCASEGIACAPYSPLGGGLLTGKYLGGGAGRLTEDERYGARYAPGYMHEAAQGLCDIAEGMDIHPATLAVAWVARHWAGPMPILSARSAEQLAPSLDAIGYDMDDALYLMLAELVPSPPPANDRLEDR
ncbi:aldo/keto reductase [Rhodalgimonas zhirmunskyi]|uniref:Aldo/keto reductase n=1 Tax=Rhodalgimonas zhirmunskyi TaxID=2964767 RepID=A0AAJ1UBK6_9RHOB|nr:aldo/keto reductase [Rhodoalgimonas zhirmunskyi]MDQ2093566.1 aldo/keto reductase [Rhodoalgimonas zhirmunskyi]